MVGPKTKTVLTAMAVVAVTLVAVAPNAVAKDRKWEFEAGIYGWLPTINGTLVHDIPGVGDEVEIDAGTLLENLSFTAMGAFSVKRAKWAFMADFIYLKETASDSETLDHLGGTTLTADYKLNSWILNLAVGREVTHGRKGTLNFLLGARYFSAESTLGLTSDAPLNLDETAYSKPAVWNGIIGAESRFELGKSWYLPLYLDLGTGGSDFTWQGMAAVGYDFGWISPVLGYRHLSFNQGSDSAVDKLSFGGPELGVAFRF